MARSKKRKKNAAGVACRLRSSRQTGGMVKKVTAGTYGVCPQETYIYEWRMVAGSRTLQKMCV